LSIGRTIAEVAVVANDIGPLLVSDGTGVVASFPVAGWYWMTLDGPIPDPWNPTNPQPALCGSGLAATVVALGAEGVTLLEEDGLRPSEVAAVGGGDSDALFGVVIVAEELTVSVGVADGPLVGLGLASFPPPR
jgi:hypothetical protein